MAGVKEIHNYPFDPIIKFKQPRCSFSYKVIKEGVYPNKSSLAYTLPPNKYQISNNYIMETTWEKSKNQFSSSKSTTDAANLFHKEYISQKEPKHQAFIYLAFILKYWIRQKIENDKALKLYNSVDVLVLETLDEGNILRDPYRRLCAIEPHLPREGAVSKERQKINEEMARLIPISIIDVNTENQPDC
ncbi:13425_t:CDS:2 [Funneliformis geosporum]|nr:13425_t:CDS:2 [Funneliformis geosporum]